MGSLAHCLRKAAKSLRPGDAESIRDAAAAFEREGLSPSAAAERAVLELLADEQRTLAGFVEQVTAAGGTAPAWVGEAMAAREVSAEPEPVAVPEPTPEPVAAAPEAPEPAPAEPAPESPRVETAAAEAATSPLNDKPEPTEAQREAGNYAKGHLSLHGLDIAIENPAGTRRRPEWSPLAHHYGYIRSVRVKPQGPADASNDPAADAHLFGDSAEAESIRSQGFYSLGVDRQKVVHGRMVSAFHDREVLRAVIESIPIDVVHGLVSSKLTTKQLLRDPSVFLDGFSRPLDNAVRAAAVARVIDAIAASHPSPLTRLGAEKQAAFGMSSAPRANGESDAAGVTGNNSSHSAYYAPNGADGDHVDVFLGPGAEDASLPVFVVDQVTKDGRLDEQKVMLGFRSTKAAGDGYLANYTPGWNGVGAVTPTTWSGLKEWLLDGDTSRSFAGSVAATKFRADAQQALANAGRADAEVAGERGNSLTAEVTSGGGVDVPSVGPAGGRVDSAAQKGFADSGLANSGREGNRREGSPTSPGVDRGVDIPSRSPELVLADVNGLRSDLKIIDGVVQAVPIAVMDNLGARERPSDGGLDDQPMLEPLASNSVDNDADQPVRAAMPWEKADVPAGAGSAQDRTSQTSVKPNNTTHSSNMQKSEDFGKVGFFSIPAPGSASSPLSLSDRARIREAARTAESEFGIRINVVPNTSDPSVPDSVRGTNPQAHGYTNSAQAWLFTDNIASLAHAQNIIAHEVVGHVGVDRLVGRDEWQPIIDTVQGVLDGSISAAADAGQANRAAALGPVERPAAVSEEVARIIREANERYPGASPTTLAREAVAVMAERGVKASMLDRLLAAMRRALRRVFRRLAWSDAELRDLLVRSAEGLRRAAAGAEPEARIEPDAVDSMAQGGGVPRTGVPLSVDAYHGTPAGDVGQFESRNGGIYFTDRPDLASDYTQRRGVFQSRMAEGAAVYKKRISMQNPLVIDAMGARNDNIPTPWHEWKPKVFGNIPKGAFSIRTAAQRAFAEGHDGLVVLNTIDTPTTDSTDRRKSTIYVVRDGDQLSGGFAQGAPDPNRDGDAILRADRTTEEGVRTTLGAIDAAQKAAGKRSNWKRIPDWIDTKRPWWLNLLSRTQIIEIGKDVVPRAVAFGKMAERMDAAMNKLMEPAAKEAERWAKLISAMPQEAAKMARIMHRATIEQFDPDGSKPATSGGRPFPGSLVQSRLVADFNALPDEAKEVYRAVRESYKARSRATMVALIERIEAAALDGRKKAEAIAMVRAHFESAELAGPYFPLARFGDYWIRARKPGQSEPEFILRESAWQWRSTMAELQAEGYTIEASGKKIREMAADPGPGAGFMTDIVAILDKAASDDLAPLIDRKAAEALQDEVWQLYLQSLPELSMRKHSIHRQGTPGYSEDALRAFAHHMSHGARQIARLQYGHKMARELVLARDEAPMSKDPAKAADIVSALDGSYQWQMNPTGSRAASMLTAFGFAFHLGLTPAAAIVNLAQTATVAYPILGARFGFDRASAALLTAAKDYVRTVKLAPNHEAARAELEAEFGGDMGRMLQDLEDSGRIDRTQTMALTGLGEDRAAISLTMQKVMGPIAWGFQQAERLNREATAIAGYRLARQAGMSHDDALAYADTAVVRSHFNYNSSNRARLFRGDVAKVLLLFKQYAQHSLYLLWRNVHQATLGESPEVKRLARRELAGITGMTFALGGLAALPFYGEAMWILSALFAAGDDDDEPKDAEMEFRQWLAGGFAAMARAAGQDEKAAEWGRFGGELVTKGPWNAFAKIDVSSRISLDDLLWRSPNREMTARESTMDTLQQVAGPVAGIGFQWAGAIDTIAQGEWLRGIESALPKAFKDVMKGWRYQMDEAATNVRGLPIVERLSLYESIMQGVGFTPARLDAAYERAAAAGRIEERLLQRRREIYGLWYKAVKEPDPVKAEAARKVAQAATESWNSANADWRIDFASVMRSVEARDRAAAQAVDGATLNPTVARRLQQEPY